METKFQEYFKFSKKEMNGIWILCLLILAIVISPVIYKRFFKKPEVYHFDDFDREMQQFLALEQKKEPYKEFSGRKGMDDKFKAIYFRFNPNKLPGDLWQKLGLSAKQVRVIKNYESKGGRFFRKEDLKKIYSISAEQYAALEPYIHIPESVKAADHDGSFAKIKSRANYYPGRTRSLEVVELNSADSAMLESLRGIGPSFAARIIKFRNRIGGFYKKEQLLDVYGIDSGIYENFKTQLAVDQALIQTININTAGFEELKKHPYLTYKQMNAIIQYRRQHGRYDSIQDLEKIAIINKEILRKIGPYLTF